MCNDDNDFPIIGNNHGGGRSNGNSNGGGRGNGNSNSGGRGNDNGNSVCRGNVNSDTGGADKDLGLDLLKETGMRGSCGHRNVLVNLFVPY